MTFFVCMYDTNWSMSGIIAIKDSRRSSYEFNNLLVKVTRKILRIFRISFGHRIKRIWQISSFYRHWFSIEFRVTLELPKQEMSKEPGIENKNDNGEILAWSWSAKPVFHRKKIQLFCVYARSHLGVRFTSILRNHEILSSQYRSHESVLHCNRKWNVKVG